MMSIPPEITEEGKRLVEEGATSAAEFISDRPLTSVAVAAVLGFFVGLFIF
jgi:ElaB/YqjD/DUF883 family membrane-anchored ribosome-binding protein